MSIASRIHRAEEGLGDALLWEEALKISARTGQSPQEIVDDAIELVRKYEHFEVPLPGGKVNIEPMLRAMSEGEGFDYAELVQDFKLLLRRQAARERRAAKRNLGHLED